MCLQDLVFMSLWGINMECRIFFSAATCGFYDEQDKGRFEHWPDDAVEVSAAVRNEFTGIPPDGKILGSVSGLPAWVDPPLPTHEEAIASAEQKKSELLIAAQATIINWQSKLLLGVISDDEKTSLIAWLAYIDELNAVNTSEPNWPAPPEV